MNISQYFDQVCKKYKVSDGRASAMIGVTRATGSRWRLNKGIATEENALKIAELLEVDPAIVLADLDIEQAKSEEVKSVRLRMMEILKRSAAAILITIITSGAYDMNLIKSCVLC